MMSTISAKAHWFLGIIALAVLGMLFVGVEGTTGGSNIPDIAVIDGMPVKMEEFKARWDAEQRQFAAQGLTEAQRVQKRVQLFNNMVQGKLVNREFKNLELSASGHEILREMLTNPPAGVKSAPQFQTDSVFDPKKYEAWFMTDSAYQSPFVRNWEYQLKTSTVPYKQLSEIINASYHSTDLEAKFGVENSENKTQFVYISNPTNSYEVKEEDITDAEVDAYFNANPDSFYVATDLRKVEYVSLKIEPSAYDDQNTLQLMQTILNGVKNGTDFEEEARRSSEDLASAKNGGRLGLVDRKNFVPEFSDAAWALDSGEISEPIKTQFGYHIIKSYGKKAEDGVEKVNVAHILQKIAPGTETVDSLKNELANVKAVARSKTLAEAAKELGLAVHTSNFFAKGGALDSLGYIQGMSSYAFSEQDSVSDVLSNAAYIVIAKTAGTLKAGSRSKEVFKDIIVSKLVEKKQFDLAKKAIEDNKAFLTSASAADIKAKYPKIQLDTSLLVGRDGYVRNLGYGSDALIKISGQKDGEWGPVTDAKGYAVLAKVIKRENITDAEKAGKIKQKREENIKYGAGNLVNLYMANLYEGADIKDNSDFFFYQ